MNKQISSIQILFLGLFAVIAYSCAGISSITGENQSQVYYQSFERIAEVVEQAVNGSNLNISQVFKSEDETEITLIVTSNILVNGRSTQEEQGKVVITELEMSKVRVEVKNPGYHYTVPSYQREKYDRIIFNQINSILGKE